jgi:hypothetical protein
LNLRFLSLKEVYITKKLEEFDKENPNYEFLTDAIKAGKVTIDEDNHSASIFAKEMELKFQLGMKAYLEANGFDVLVIFEK